MGRAIGLDVSAYVIRGVMIDTGFPRAAAEIAEAVRELGVTGAIITHWHEDHAGNVPLLAERGVPLLMRADTEAIVRNPPALQLYRRAVWGGARTITLPFVQFDANSLEQIHAPGHSSDHQAVFDRNTGTIFTGDLWLGVHVSVLHTAEDPYEIVNSLRRVVALSPERMFDAHRGLVETPVRALEAKAEWLTNTLGEVERRVDEGWSDSAIVDGLLGGKGRADYASRFEYSRRNFVRAVRGRRPERAI
ncbi:MAG: MBL fold metallo-hydrolase [Gemmatimonadaceae bacterium]